jgi:S1-C subfamily serine protease
LITEETVMPDRQSHDRRAEGAKTEKKTFIRETIVRDGKPDRKVIGLGIVMAVVVAVVFGVVSSLTFVLCRPVWEKHFPGNTAVETVTIPRDDEQGGQAQAASSDQQETAANDPDGGSQGAVSKDDAEAIYEKVRAMLDGYKSGIKDYKSVYGELENMVLSFNRSLVMLSRPADAGDPAMDSGGRVPGLIVAVTSSEVVILTDTRLMDPLDTMTVTFSNQQSVSAYLKAVDSTDRLAVYGIDVSRISEGLADYIEAATLGDSRSLDSGDPVIAVGSAYGIPKSTGFGTISFVNNSVTGVDRQVRLYISSIAGYPDSCGFLLNLDGEVVGRVTTEYDEDGRSGQLSAESVSDLKGYIERLSNGSSSAYLGILGTTLTRGMIDKDGIDKGVYVNDCVTDGPAYTAGIQRGDILTRVNDDEISSLKDLQGSLEKLDVGGVVELMVLRDSRDGYRELSFTTQAAQR